MKCKQDEACGIRNNLFKKMNIKYQIYAIYNQFHK